jgi:hypothetical protein
MYHYLEHISRDIYHAHIPCLQPCEIIEDLSQENIGSEDILPKIKYYYTGRTTNYGKLFNKLDELFPKIYLKTDREELSDVSNTNRLIGWYIDMDLDILLKENLSKKSFYAITDKDYSKGDLWISKPSHPYIGSGKMIIIGTKNSLKNRKRQSYKGIPIHWVLQPLVSNIKLWHDEFKFDFRMYAVIFSQVPKEPKVRAAVYNVGICRRAVNPYNPKVDPNSALTNISIQEKIYGFDSEFNIPLVYDNIRMTEEIVRDLMGNLIMTQDPNKKVQFLILGLDILMMKDGSYRLIEVNKDPYFELDVSNNENIASMGFITGAFGHILPSLLRGKPVKELKDWRFVN